MRLEWILSGRKPRFEIWELDHLMHRCGWKHSWWNHWFYVGPYLKSKQASDRYFKPDNAYNRLGSSNGRPQSFMMPNASHLYFKTQSLLMLRNHARLGQFVYTTLIPRPLHRLTQVYTALRQDRSAGWRKYIRLWDQNHFTGWRKATGSIPREISTKNHRSRVTWLCQQRGSENKNSTCSN